MLGRKILLFNISKQISKSLFSKQYFCTTTAKAPRKQCLYKVLNLSTDATIDEIKKSYLELAKKYHPDVLTGETVQEGKFLEISEAYQTLSDAQKRQIYDSDNGIIIARKKPYHPGFEKDSMYANIVDGGFKLDEEEKSKLDDYFQNKYFKNKDYFKYKTDETDPWNVTRKLYNQHRDRKEAMEEDYVVFHPFTFKAYHVHKDELKYAEDRHLFFRLLYDYRYLMLCGLILVGIFGFAEVFMMNKEDQSQKDRPKSQKAQKSA